MSNFKKKNLIDGWVVFSVICVVMVLVSVWLPDMGKNVLKYQLTKGVSYLLLGLAFLVPRIMHLLQEDTSDTVNGRPRQESLEEMMENGTGHISMKSVLSVVFGIILVCAGLKVTIACVRDISVGPVWIRLESARVECGSGSTEQGSSENYKLYGIANGEEYVFDLKGGDMYENLMRKINYQMPEMIVIYYPHSKAMMQVQIYFENNEKMVLPQGDRAYDSRSLEKLPEGKGEKVEDISKYENSGPENTVILPSKPTTVPGTYEPTVPVYSEVALEELSLSEVQVGDDFGEVVRTLTNLPDGEKYEVRMDTSDMDTYMEHLKNVVMVRTEYEVEKELGCDILYKGDIELILIYNKDSLAIESIFARRVR